jgi:hypothetical protein
VPGSSKEAWNRPRISFEDEGLRRGLMGITKKPSKICLIGLAHHRHVHIR